MELAPRGTRTRAIFLTIPNTRLIRESSSKEPLDSDGHEPRYYQKAKPPSASHPSQPRTTPWHNPLQPVSPEGKKPPRRRVRHVYLLVLLITTAISTVVAAAIGEERRVGKSVDQV